MPRAKRVCPGCQAPIGPGRCPTCTREADRARGNFTQRGYGGPAWSQARRACLDRDRTCVLCHAAPANTADHYPESRAELVARGVTDPDAPQYLRGLCRPCHSRETAKRQPGGWNVR